MTDQNSLSDSQRARIDSLLYDGDDINQFRKMVPQIETTTELQTLARQINWDDQFAFARLDAVLQHPLCDRGTALMLYWLGDPCGYAEDALKHDPADYNRPWKEFMARLQGLLLSDHFHSNTIRFDPLDGWNLIQRRELERNTAIPAELKRPNC